MIGRAPSRVTTEPRPTTQVWTIIVTGNGRAFCTGADVSEISGDGRVLYDEPYLSTFAAMGGPAGGDPTVSHDGQADPRRGQRHLLRRRPRLGHDRRHRDRVRSRRVLRSARQHRPGVGARGRAPRRVLPTNIAMRMALMGRHERMSAQRGVRPRARLRGRRARTPRRAGARDRRHRQPQRTARRARHAPRDPQRARPPALRGRGPRRGVPRARRAHRRRARRDRRPSSRSASPKWRASERSYETIIYETSRRSRRDHHAQSARGPQRVRSHDVQEIRDAWQRIKDDTGVHAVVLRAAGDRAFCAGLDTKKPYGQPDDVWNHEDPGELLSPKWQKVWKPVVCAVQGICTAGAFYFFNESDIVICSDDATFFDSHVTYGLVSAIEPVGLMRRGRTRPRHCASRSAATTSESPRDTALRISLVTEVVDVANAVGAAHEIAAAIARKPTAATQGTVRAIWESLDRPYRAAMEQGLPTPASATRSGRPRWPRPGPTGPSRGSADGHAACPSSASASRDGARPRSGRAGVRVRTAAGTPGARLARPTADAVAARVEPGARVGVLLRNRPAAGRSAARRLLRAGACVVAINPGRGDDRVRDDLATSMCRIARRRTRRPRSSSAPSSRRAPSRSAASSSAPSTLEGVPPGSVSTTRAVARPGVAVEMLTSGTTGPPKRVPLTLRDLPARARRGEALRDATRPTDVRLRSGVVDRQLAARAPRRPVPGAAVRERRSIVLPAREVPRRRVGRCGAPPPPEHGRASYPPRCAWCSTPISIATDLASIRSVVSGTAPLIPDDADAFHREVRRAGAHLVRGHRVRRRASPAGTSPTTSSSGPRSAAASVGRTPGCELRVVDAETGTALGPGRGRVCSRCKARQLGDALEWTRTTDLARIDADGFLWILGRADQAIIRGGFKVLPDDGARRARARSARCSVPRSSASPTPGSVQVPVAAVELRADAGPVAAADLLAGAVAASWPATRSPTNCGSSRPCPGRESGKVDLTRSARALFAASADTEHVSAEERWT